jgi:hypothetical protein
VVGLVPQAVPMVILRPARNLHAEAVVAEGVNHHGTGHGVETLPYREQQVLGDGHVPVLQRVLAALGGVAVLLQLLQAVQQLLVEALADLDVRHGVRHQLQGHRLVDQRLLVVGHDVGGDDLAGEAAHQLVVEGVDEGTAGQVDQRSLDLQLGRQGADDPGEAEVAEQPHLRQSHRHVS